MKAVQLLTRGMAIAVAILLITVPGAGQNLQTSSDITGSGTINVKGNIVNTNGGGTTVNIAPAVVMNSTTPQSITATVAGSDINFTTLTMILAGNKLIDTDIEISTNWELGTGVNPLTGDVSFNSASTIAVVDASSYDPGSSGALDFSGGTVSFTKATATQTILNTAGGVSYGALSLSGGATKSFQTGGTVTAADVTHSGGDLTVDRAFTITSTGSFATVADVTAAMSFDAGVTAASITTLSAVTSTLTNNATVATLSIGTLAGNAGTIENTAGGGISFTTAATNGTGAIETSGAGDLTFASLSGNSGTIRSTAGGGLTFTGPASNAGTISAASGSAAIAFNGTLSNSGASAIVSAGGNGVTFTGDVTNGGGATISAGDSGFVASLDFNSTTVDNTGGVIVLGSQGTSTFAGSFAVGGSGTLTLDNASVWSYDGGGQSMASATYGILRTEGTASSLKTALGAITAEQFDNGGTGDVAITTDMDTYALTVNGASDNTNSTLLLGGSNGFSFGTLTAAGGTVVYDGVTGDVASQSIATGDYFNLQFAGNAPKNIAAATVSTGNNVDLISGVTLNVAGTGTLNVGQTGSGVGALTLASGSTLDNDGNINVAGDLDNSGSLTNDGVVTVGY